MKNYKLCFLKVKQGLNREVLIKNTCNFLHGASVAMEATGANRLQTTFMGEWNILFQTDSENFISYFRSQMAQYGIEVIQFNFNERPLTRVASQLRW